MHKKFEINRTKIMGGCQSERKAIPYDSKSDLPLALYFIDMNLLLPLHEGLS